MGLRSLFRKRQVQRSPSSGLGLRDIFLKSRGHPPMARGLGLRQRFQVALEQGTGYRVDPSQKPETVEAVFAGAKIVRGAPAAGSQVAVTSQGLNVTPLDVEGARKALAVGLRAAGVSGVGVANWALNQSKILEPTTIPFETIRSVEPEGRPGFFSLPRVR